ncbi:unnamed protein product [Cylindrotheca closterium]|uniref:J domain-containing protein n=1 Tax=Cylindrotheca closterium TaxID=2856 RepID=A0AAD2JKT9_9STRA|nr:unnamed protein product [Cylindrotheca closterium]
MAAVKRLNARKGICNTNPKYSVDSSAPKMRAPQAANAGPPLPQLYVDTITRAFGEDADLHRDVLRIAPDAMPIEQRIAYFKRGREIMKQAGSAITAPRDLPPTIRARLKAINMAYDIISNPEWHRQYVTRNEQSPRIKSGVRFNDHIQEHVYELDPAEREYMRERRERRMQRLKELEADALSNESFWNDLLADMENFELGLGGFLQAFPDQIAGQELQEALTDDSSFPDTQSFSSWLSSSVKKGGSLVDDDIETSSYMSSFNPFAEETPRSSSKSSSRGNVRSPTSLPQELAETNRVPRGAGKKETRNSNPFRDEVPDSSSTFNNDDDTTSLFSDGPLDISPVTSPFDDEDDDDDATNPFEDGALDITNDDAPDDVSNPFSAAASDSRFSIGTFQKMQKERRAQRASTRSSNSQISQDLKGAFDNPRASAALDNDDGRLTQRQSKNPFDDEENDVSGDQTSVFDGLDEVWDDEQGVHVDGESVISDLSESVVAKRAKQKQQAFQPFAMDTVKEDTPGSSNLNKDASAENPSWGGSENEQVGFTAAASAIAACCANIVADCQKNTEAMANLEMKNFTTIDFPSMFTAEQSKKPELEQDPFDEMEELFKEMGDELNDELGEF